MGLGVGPRARARGRVRVRVGVRVRGPSLSPRRGAPYRGDTGEIQGRYRGDHLRYLRVEERPIGEIQGRYRGGIGEITFAISASRSAMNSSSVGPGDVGEI